ncbi:MAG: glycosyltransferase [Candidatus Omnitrophota bacterium]
MIKISIVIPVYNAVDTIGLCLESLINQTVNKKDYEIIVIDNGSDDGSFTIIKEFVKKHNENKFILLQELKKGPSEARNRGIKSSSGTFIAFTDSDCVADKDWLKDIISAFDDEKIGAVAGNIKGYKPRNIIQKLLSITTLKGLKEEKIFDEFTLTEGGFSTTNLSIRKSLFQELEGFLGEQYGEDHDLCARVYRKGFKIKYITNALVYHIHRDTLWGLIVQGFNFGKSHPRNLKKWGKKRLIISLPRYTYSNKNFIFPIWLDFNPLDKKAIIAIFLGFYNKVFFLFFIVYLVYFFISLKRQYKKLCIKVSYIEILLSISLLLLKSISMTFGRIYGSYKNKVICI